MAHQQQQSFVETILKRHYSLVVGASNVLEVGSQDISGSVRKFFDGSQNYLGVDLGKARGVDLVSR